MQLDSLPLGENPNQQNLDTLNNELNNEIHKAITGIPNTTPEGSLLRENGESLYGYTKYHAEGGNIIGLIGDSDDVPEVFVGGYVSLLGDAQGYVPTGHKPGDTVMVNRIIFPYFKLKPGIKGNDRIIEGIREDGLTGWFSPKNIDTESLLKSLHPESFDFERIELPLVGTDYQYGNNPLVDDAVREN
jgi:hypothetical protein